MASITQNITSYIQGISHQPDDMMTPGQVRDLENGLPDITSGLIKRNGAEFIASLDYANTGGSRSAANTGNWFSYYRDKTEGGYIGTITGYGDILMWKLDGTPVTVYNMDVSGGASTTRQYLTNNGNSAAEDLKFTTINDYTFVTNPKVTVRVDTGRNSGNNNPWKPEFYWTDSGLWQYGAAHDYVAREPWPATSSDPLVTRNITRNELPYKKFLQLKQIQQGVEYAVRAEPSTTSAAWSSTPTYSGGKTNTAVRVKLNIVNTGNTDGDCPTVGTGIYKFTSVGGTAKEEAIYIRITQTGQSHINPSASNINSGSDYKCTYNFQHDLLYGGRGWNVGDTTDTLNGPLDVATADQAEFSLTVEEVASDDAFNRQGTDYDLFAKCPPVSFQANNPVNPRQIYQILACKLELRGYTTDLQSNGLVVWHAEPFDLTPVDPTLIKVTGTNITDITELPNEGPSDFPNYFVKVTNSTEKDVDDYYLRWDNSERPGKWVETVGDDIRFRIDPFTMPHVLYRQSDGTFVFDQYRKPKKAPFTGINIGSTSVAASEWYKDYPRGPSGWEHRKTGDDATNPFPSFIGKKITNTFFHRNRLGFLHDGSISLSKAGSIGNFFNTSALTTTANDPINIDAGSIEPTTFVNSIETNTGLVVFGESEQYLLHTDSDSLTNETGKLSNISTYNYSPSTDPMPLGTTISFVDSTGTNGRFFEMAGIKREGEPLIIEQTKIVQDLFPKDIDLTANSREASTVFLSKTNQQYIWGYRYFNQGDKRLQSAWFKWKFAFSIRYITVIEGLLYVVSTEGKLYSINLDTNGYSIAGGANNPWGQPGTLNIHLDGAETHTSVTQGTDTTTVTPSLHKFSTGGANSENMTGEPYAIGADGVIVQGTGNTTSSSTWTFPGLLTAPVTTGYAFDLSVKFPKIFFKKQQGEAFVSDITASLTVQRVKLHFGPVGHTSVEVSRQGKADFTIENNVTFADWIESDGTPVITERVVETPIYEKSSNFEIELKSTYPGPASLHSMSWEGEYSAKHHKRV